MNSQPQNLFNVPVQQRQVVVQQRQSNIRGGVFGRMPISVQSPIPDIFNDDEVIIERVKEEKKETKI